MVHQNDEIKAHQMPFGRGVLKDQRANNPPWYHFFGPRAAHPDGATRTLKSSLEDHGSLIVVKQSCEVVLNNSIQF